MTEVVVDSSAWIEYLRGSKSLVADLVDQALEDTVILLPNLVRVEVLRGFATEALANQAASLLNSAKEVQITGAELASQALLNHWFMRASGHTVRGTVDLLIGTWCIENGIAILHADRDFTVMEKCLGLKFWRGKNPLPYPA